MSLAFPGSSACDDREDQTHCRSLIMFAIKHLLLGAALAGVLGVSTGAARAGGYVTAGYSYAPTSTYCAPTYTPAPVYYTTPVYAPAPRVVYTTPVYTTPTYCPPP